MKKSSVSSFSTTHVILLSFLAAVLLGTLLLCLPISSADGKAVPFVDALFTATTSTCVTGLVVMPTFSAWSIFGQAVILVLIQIGGLGIITVMAGMTVMLHKKMGLGDRLLLQDAFNLNSLSGIAAFVKKVILGTFAFEAASALLYMTVFVPQFGAKGIWISVFNSVSAFCNAGMDIIGESSLCAYVTNPIINLTTVLLIVCGGIGYIVWWDIARILRIPGRHKLSHLSLHSKIALVSTLVLIAAGMVGIFIFEYSNPDTLGGLTFFQKIQASLFQSVTTRTAGFATLPQESLRSGSAMLSLLLMFIGGSPVGTAGGIKTVTFVVLIATAVSSVKNSDQIRLFGRAISTQAVKKAVAVCAMAFATAFISTLVLSCVTDASALDIMYETFSASATVGLSRGITSALSTAGKLTIAATMYLGRVGAISIAAALNLKREQSNIIKEPTESISVG